MNNYLDELSQGVIYTSYAMGKKNRSIIYIKIGKLQKTLSADIYTKMVLYCVERYDYMIY